GGLVGGMCEAGGVRIAVLGPLAMWAADGTPLDVRGVRLRGLLARLALSAGRPVSVETLVDGLWGSEAPSANALQSLVSRLHAGLPATESSISVQSGPARPRISPRPPSAAVTPATASPSSNASPSPIHSASASTNC